MKKALFLICIIGSLFACKEDDSTEPIAMDGQNNNSCGERQICFNLNNSSYTNGVFMYQLDDSTYFAKYESNGTQLSIDWFSSSPNTGTFPAGMQKGKGMSRIYWFSGVNNEQWMSKRGEVVITKHENKTVSATFSGMLFRMVNNQPTSDSLEVKNGVFMNGQYS